MSILRDTLALKIICGGLGSGRHKSEVSNDMPVTEIGTVRWAIHPTLGAIFDPKPLRSHSEWFEKIGVPVRLFDKLPRGTAQVDSYSKSVQIDSYRTHQAPEEIVSAIKKSYPHFTIDDQSNAGYGELPAWMSAGGPGSGRHKSFYGNKPKIAVDFDGTIHHYGGYSKTLGPPIDGALKAIKAFQKANMEVVIHTARPTGPVKQWLKDNNFPNLKVTNKKPVARAYIDDRSIAFNGKWNKALVDKAINFKTHWEKKAVQATNYGPQTGTVNWQSPSGPGADQRDWYQVTIGLQPIPNDHPPSLKNPIKVKLPTPQDGWREDDSDEAKAQARKDLVILHQQMRRQYGKPEIAETALYPLFPSIQTWQ